MRMTEMERGMKGSREGGREQEKEWDWEGG